MLSGVKGGGWKGGMAAGGCGDGDGRAGGNAGEGWLRCGFVRSKKMRCAFQWDGMAGALAQMHFNEYGKHPRSKAWCPIWSA